ncbi:hypothetical protein L1049_022075 [Liquidambar formosana]|uniref:Uncharacterized protein n=1 Tax=Liquidambar formosana TaxID=63359 RepID=A0AAP0WQI3_LIQFO
MLIFFNSFATTKMARVAVIVAVTFFLFAFTHAHTPLDLPENDVAASDLTTTLPESDTKTAILLPSEKPESETATVVEWEADSTADPKSFEYNVNTADAKVDVSESDPATITAAGLTQPLRVVSFRPVNRQFHHMHAKGGFPFRFPHRCRHHFKHSGPRFNGREEWNEEEDVMKPHHHHHRHHHHMEEGEGREHEEREEGGFMKSFRKFLNHF